MRLILLDPHEVCLYPLGAAEPDTNMMCYPYLLDPGVTEEDADWRRGGEVPNHQVVLQNQDNQALSLLRIPPKRARLEDNDGTELFSGSIGGITLSSTANIQLIS